MMEEKWLLKMQFQKEQLYLAFKEFQVLQDWKNMENVYVLLDIGKSCMLQHYLVSILKKYVVF